MEDLGETLRLIAQGSQAAFSRLYCEQQPIMLRFATGLMGGHGQAAEDMVDEAFFEVWRKAGQYSGDGHPQGWLRRIVRNKVIDWLRKQPRAGVETPADDALAQLSDESDTPEQALEKLSDANELRRLLSHLTLEHREALWLCYYEELPLSEIAATVECPEGTVKTRLFHARRALRAMMGDQS